MVSAHAIWPDLTYSTWRETAVTLQLWTQIVGKIRLALAPWVNHSWQVPLYVTARGLGTSVALRLILRFGRAPRIHCT